MRVIVRIVVAAFAIATIQLNAPISHAQMALVVPTCGSASLTSGSTAQLTEDTVGNFCASFGGVTLGAGVGAALANPLNGANGLLSNPGVSALCVFNIDASNVPNCQSAIPDGITATTQAPTDSSTKLATMAALQALPACQQSSQFGFVGDGVTFNDAAFTSWWSSTGNNPVHCLQLGPGKFAFSGQIAATLASHAQTNNIASGTYDNTTGIVTLTLPVSATFAQGQSLEVWGLTGTGAFANLNGTFTTQYAVGTTVTYQAQPGLGATTITGGAFSGDNQESLFIAGAGSNQTRLYWPGPDSTRGIKITSGGTTNLYGAFGSSFHIRDMTIATGAVNAGNGLDLEGFPYPFGVANASDLTHVEVQGDDYLAPNHGADYWTSDIDLNCWSNVNIYNVNTYNLPNGTGQGNGLVYGCFNPSLIISSGTYNSTTGLVTLTLSAVPPQTGSVVIQVSGLTGTGAFASLGGIFGATISGTTVTYTAATGLGAATITGGTTQAQNYTVVANIVNSSFNFAQTGILLLSYWQGITVDQTNFNSVHGGGVEQASGQTGVLSGLTIQASQFGGLDAPISLAPTSGSPIADAQILNNIIYISQNNAQGISVGAAGNLANLVTESGNVLIGGGASLSGTFGTIIQATNAAIVGNAGQNLDADVTINAGSSNVSVIGNSFSGTIAAGLLNNGCTTCIVEGNPGINPIGPSSVTLGATPFTYTNGPTPAFSCLTGGAVSSVTIGGDTVASGTGTCVPLAPNQAETITYSATPTMVVSVQ